MKVYCEADKRADGYWVIDPNNEPSHQEDGPYPTKADQKEACAGLNRFYEQHPKYATNTTNTTNAKGKDDAGKTE